MQRQKLVAGKWVRNHDGDTFASVGLAGDSDAAVQKHLVRNKT